MRLVGSPKLLDSEGTLVTGSLTYTSRDGHAGCYLKYAYLAGAVNAPGVWLAHGYSEDANAITATHLARVARRGCVAFAPGMRGRNGAAGSNDASGREILDILDGITALRAAIGPVMGPALASMGYSGGGGNVYAALAKLPDTFGSHVSHFGMSSYGTFPGWWGTNPAYQGIIESAVGGTPSAAPAEYAARDHIDPVCRVLRMAPVSVSLFIAHDNEDTTVSYRQAIEVQRRAAELGISDRVEVLLDYQTGGDPHGYPATVTSLLAVEDLCTKRIQRVRPWRLPVIGDTVVAGYMVGKSREVWLCDSGGEDAPESVGYCRHRARVRWDGDDFEVTPLTGAMRVLVRHNGLSQQADITATTTITAV